MTINTELIDQLLADYKEPGDLLGENGLLKQLAKAPLERAMRAELTHHLGYFKHDSKGNKSGNSRNGKSKKTLKGDFGTLPRAVAADLKQIYTAPTRQEGERELEEFAAKWDRHYPTISKPWRLNWERLAVFYSYPA